LTFRTTYPSIRGVMTKTKQKKLSEKELDIQNPYRTDPNTRSSMPKRINLALRIVSPCCPVCGDLVQDKRHKGKCVGGSLFNRSFTDTGVTRECRCGLRFHFTWRTFVNVMKKKLEKEKQPQMRLNLDIWITMVENYFGLNEESQLARIEALKQRSRKIT